MFYGLAALTTMNPDLDPIHGSLAIRIVLSFIPELICLLGYIVAGILTRNVRTSLARGTYRGGEAA